ncbi:MAG: hypothetical protein UX13_C0038G0008 [Candidatus Woesebacteria bacterium GW2011_GWB1_45_5]|uniref:Uncharacterized protein n=1 Tax=Candidatus Woesebacteria bacterium GW2011_GWB1_45_5 TaxID=1618581 RepID=A0A0G1MMF3_9BACT|nr:MAG: hypothetical protein UX13_C0038G0008 [Candidatus Woesebacteria bacterium GW2011_GWB1_45_5]
MSKLFFDHLIVLDQVEVEIRKSAKTKEEQEELWGLVDEIVSHKALDVILGRLHRDHHEQFLDIFHKNPHDETLIFDYLKEKIGENVEDVLRQELGNVAFDLLREIKGPH